MDIFFKILSEWNIRISDKQMDLFERYYKLLVSWNEKINLTAVTEKDDVFIKHFADSVALIRYADLSGKRILDIGTGAGFPGVPISIMCPGCSIVLADSLNKRIRFLDELVEDLELDDIITVHGRAEDLAFDKRFREGFDFVVSRAVANMSVLSEYCLPFVKPGGVFVSYKGASVDEELSDAKNAISVLCGTVDRVEKYSIPFTEYDRSLCFINKVACTDNKYPRKAGTPSKDPL
ncbi:MAG: 16S rRNA (guanine(527)-N(7))-methyltransferase RsmG [Lachnospiraceae bacterium]|nr:16S rRNA (guanine(527)-N(7))-methyltransferase RsmG [Lachnospiraceae bacterium]